MIRFKLNFDFYGKKATIDIRVVNTEVNITLFSKIENSIQPTSAAISKNDEKGFFS